MTADLAAIRARLAAATPGPWAQGDPMFGWSNAQCVVSISDAAMGRDVMSPSLTPALFDVDLIANAPADLAALCDEVESLRDAVQRVRELHSPEHYYGEPGDEDCPHAADYDGPRHFYGQDEFLMCEDTASEDAFCGGCPIDREGDHQPYPCPTIRALDGAE